MAEKTTVIGIDGASKKTGVAIIQDDKLTNYSLLDYHKIIDSDKRITEMTNGITDLLANYSPAVVWMEDTWTSKNPKVAQMLTTILGGVRFWCNINNCEFHTIMPSAWRKELGMTGSNAKRDELKKKSIEYVYKKFNIEVTDDVADAICIAVVGNGLLGEKG